MPDTTITLTMPGMDDCDAAVLVGVLREALAQLPHEHRATDFLAGKILTATTHQTWSPEPAVFVLSETYPASTSGYDAEDSCLICHAHISDPHAPDCPSGESCSTDDCDADMGSWKCPWDKASCLTHCGHDDH